LPVIDSYFGCEDAVCDEMSWMDEADQIPGISCKWKAKFDKEAGTDVYQAVWESPHSYDDKLNITKAPNTCGFTHCTSKQLRYKLWYDPISQNVERLETAYKGLKSRTGKELPFQIVFGKNIVSAGMVVAIKGGKNDKYCRGEEKKVKCQLDKIGDSEKFLIENAGNGTIAFKGGQDQKYCTVNSAKKVQCKSDALGEKEKFLVVNLAEGKFALLHIDSQKFCKDTGSQIKCDSKEIVGTQQKFHAEQAGAPLPTPPPAVCPIGYGDSGQVFLSDGGGEFDQRSIFAIPHPFKGFEEQLKACGNVCDNRDKCTGFMISALHNKCLTYTGGMSDKDSTDWTVCVKAQ